MSDEQIAKVIKLTGPQWRLLSQFLAGNVTIGRFPSEIFMAVVVESRLVDEPA